MEPRDFTRLTQEKYTTEPQRLGGHRVHSFFLRVNSVPLCLCGMFRAFVSSWLKDGRDE
jgi:hypothetical protein